MIASFDDSCYNATFLFVAKDVWVFGFGDARQHITIIGIGEVVTKLNEFGLGGVLDGIGWSCRVFLQVRYVEFALVIEPYCCWFSSS